MAIRLLGQDQLISVYDGGAFGAAGPTYGSAIPVQAFARSIRIRDKVNTVSVRGCGDQREKLRPTFGESELVVELLTESTGLVLVTNGGYGKITWTPISGGT